MTVGPSVTSWCLLQLPQLFAFVLGKKIDVGVAVLLEPTFVGFDGKRPNGVSGSYEAAS
jgi:hypothetical protein